MTPPERILRSFLQCVLRFLPVIYYFIVLCFYKLHYRFLYIIYLFFTFKIDSPVRITLRMNDFLCTFFQFGWIQFRCHEGVMKDYVLNILKNIFEYLKKYFWIFEKYYYQKTLSCPSTKLERENLMQTRFRRLCRPSIFLYIGLVWHNQLLVWFDTTNYWFGLTQPIIGLVWHNQLLVWFDTTNYWFG